MLKSENLKRKAWSWQVFNHHRLYFAIFNAGFFLQKQAHKGFQLSLQKKRKFLGKISETAKQKKKKIVLKRWLHLMCFIYKCLHEKKIINP
jgi:hypothetical protein